MKAITKILAVTVATLGVISAAGCAKSNNSAKTATSANWNVRTSTSVESSFSERWLNNTEVATYSVSLSEGSNNTYSVKYNEGFYKTEFSMDYYDWNAPSEVGQQITLPEGYKPADSKKELVYVYKTEYTVSGEYVLAKNGDTQNFEDSIVTECYYRLAGENLQPVYSKQEVKSTPPNALNATTKESMCVELNGTYTTYYNYDCTKATVYHTYQQSKDIVANEISEVYVTDKIGYSVFDNSQLRAAVRAFNLSGGATHTFNVFIPQDGVLQTCNAVCTSAIMLDDKIEEQLQIKNVLKSCSDYIFFDDTVGEGEDARNYRFNAVSLSINSKMSGPASTVWYSTVENSDVNYSKSVLLRMSTPLPFGLGTVTYTLKSLNLEAKQ